MNTMTPEYKAEKLASVSHLQGGGIWDINHVTLIAPAAAFLWSILQSRQRFFKPYTLPACICDFLLHCAAILFAITVYASAPQVLTGLLVLPALAAYLQPSVEPHTDPKPPSKLNGDAKSAHDLRPLPVKPFITTYRGAMMIITCISILAVDFPVFPRRFAKTESFGTSLMDLGVGSFVFAAGIVAARQSLMEDISKAPSFVARIKSSLRHSIPLLLLGLARLYSVKSLDYVEHVSEYGVHWNFFFTLALLSPTMAVLQPVFRFIPSHGILAFVIACCYEIGLYFTPGLKVYIILSERKQGDWLSQNREGVYSFIGYFAIFVAGMGLGRGILPRDPDSDEPPNTAQKDSMDEDADWLASVLGGSGEPESSAPAPSLAQKAESMPQLKPEIPKTTFAHLVKWTGLWFVFSLFALWRYGPRLFVSRRMANLGYVVWVCAFNSAQLLLFYMIEARHFPNLYKAKDRYTEQQRVKDATSRVMRAFNRNGLALFLLANLLTGLINMTIPTLHMSDVTSMAILLAYIAAVCGTGLLLDHHDVSIKL